MAAPNKKQKLTLSSAPPPTFGTNAALLRLKIVPGDHTLNIYAPSCHYYQRGTLNEAAAAFWSDHHRSPLLGAVQTGSMHLKEVIGQWNTELCGPAPEMDGPEADLSPPPSSLPSSQRVFLRPAFTLPLHGFFEQDVASVAATASGTSSASIHSTGAAAAAAAAASTINALDTRKPIQIPLSEVCKYKLADYISFNHYSYYFPRARSCEWQRNSKLFGNRGQVVVTVKETMTLGQFIQEYICGSALWKGGQLWATDLTVGAHAVEWQMGKSNPAHSTFKVAARKKDERKGEEQDSVGSGAWPETHQHMRIDRPM